MKFLNSELSSVNHSWIINVLSVISQVGLAVVNGQLYAVGGFDGTSYLKTIEVYDPDSNQWKLCGAMNYRRLGGGVGVMRAPQTENYFWWVKLELFLIVQCCQTIFFFFFSPKKFLDFLVLKTLWSPKNAFEMKL